MSNSKKFGGRWWFLAVAVVPPSFIQLHIVHIYESHHTKGKPWNSYEDCCSHIMIRTYFIRVQRSCLNYIMYFPFSYYKEDWSRCQRMAREGSLRRRTGSQVHQTEWDWFPQRKHCRREASTGWCRRVGGCHCCQEGSRWSADWGCLQSETPGCLFTGNTEVINEINGWFLRAKNKILNYILSTPNKR